MDLTYVNRRAPRQLLSYSHAPGEGFLTACRRCHRQNGSLAVIDVGLLHLCVGVRTSALSVCESLVSSSHFARAAQTPLYLGQRAHCDPHAFLATWWSIWQSGVYANTLVRGARLARFRVLCDTSKYRQFRN